MTGLDAIVLDLDDTLYDTSGRLIPAADRRAAALLAAAGVGGGEDSIVRKLTAFRAAGTLRSIREGALALGALPGVAAEVERAWLAYDPPAMHLDPEVASALDALAEIAPLGLFTAGDEPTQRRKVDRLGIERRFAACRYADPGRGVTKTDALRSLLTDMEWRAARTVVAGDRPDGDVRAANLCGCVAVLVRREGTESARIQPRSPEERAWRTIAHVRELPALLRATW